MYRKYINIVEAANKGCPIATYDIDVNLKNRQKAIDEYHYGPANPDNPESYWKDATGNNRAVTTGVNAGNQTGANTAPNVNDGRTGVFIYRTFGTATGDVYVEISV
jgi:hypothetical protein